MSDLVEKVARTICQIDSDPDETIGGRPMWTGWQDEARAAIKAVAEWGRNNFYDDKPLEEFLGELLAQLKDGSE